jgi:hypothetical protein
VFVAAGNCVKQIIDLKNMPRYLGDPIHDKIQMIGDDKSVVDSSMQGNAKNHKQHTIMSIHQVKQSITSKMVGIYFLSGDYSPTDILSKHCGYSKVWTILKVLIFWFRDTIDIHD